MVTLPNGCRCSTISVSPKNWDKKDATTANPWKIHYRFYSPERSKPYQVVIKAGINHIKDLTERREVVKELIRNERYKLEKEGFNPITGTLASPLILAVDIPPDTPFIQALNRALAKMYLAKGTKKEIRCVIRSVEKAARQLNLNLLPIYDVRRKHLRLILEQCWANSERFSPHRYNAYCSYLSMLFTELLDGESVDTNPARDLRKKKEEKKLRAVLTHKERKKINEHLRKVDYRFWLFAHIFFHSGARLTELVELKRSNVDLENQTFVAFVQKGREYRQVQRTIKDVAMPYWKEYLAGSENDQYLFGIGFLPSKKPMVTNTITRRWNQRVKKDLGIEADLYSLKHLNTTETVDLVGDEFAAKQNAHTTTEMVKSTYDVGRKEREHNMLKSVRNKFA